MQYNHFDYPNNKLPNYGSVLYYAYRKLSDLDKENLYLLDQLKSQIISCTEIYNNIEVANEKMNWWINEVSKLTSSNMLISPQLKKLSKLFDNNKLYKYLIDDIAYSIENSSNTERDFDNHITKNFIGIETLKYIYLGGKESDIDTINQLNINNEIVRHIFSMPKHFYNYIIFDKRANSSITKEDFKNLSNEMLYKCKRVKLKGKLKSLEKVNQIHYKMARKYINNIDNPFEQTLSFSPITLLFYSI